MAASAPSTALPPARSASAPASAVRGWPAATIPRTHRSQAAGGRRPTSVRRRIRASEAGDELRDVDVDGRAPAGLGTRDPRFPGRLGPRVAAPVLTGVARLAVARGHDGDPHLVLEV